MEYTRNCVAELLGCQVLQVELTTGVWEFCFDLWSSRQNRILFNNKETLRKLTVDILCKITLRFYLNKHLKEQGHIRGHILITLAQAGLQKGDFPNMY